MNSVINLLVILFICTVFAQIEKIVICNLHCWSQDNEDVRTSKMLKRLSVINPRIMVMKEIVEGSAINQLSTLLNNRSYNTMFCKGCEDTYCSPFYDSSLFALNGAKFITATLGCNGIYNRLEIKTQDIIRIYIADIKVADDEIVHRPEESQLMYAEVSQYINSTYIRPVLLYLGHIVVDYKCVNNKKNTLN
jgi:hypothetical protein